MKPIYLAALLSLVLVGHVFAAAGDGPGNREGSNYIGRDASGINNWNETSWWDHQVFHVGDFPGVPSGFPM